MRPRGLALALLWVLVLAGCARPDPLFQQESYVFGTRVEVQIRGLPREQARDAAADVLREFDRLHRMLHAWEPSELTRLNAAIAAGDAARVSPELAFIVIDAIGISGSGEHLFNPAIGGLIRLWGFQGDEFKPEVPPDEAIAQWVSAQPRMSDLRVDGDRVTSRNRAVQLDLGGYAKGYALDRANALLRTRGVAHALVNIGGNVIALGSKGDRPWRVGIQHPRAPTPLATLDLADGEAIGTSGDYQRYFEVGGRRYSHLIDPRTGYPAVSAQAVTVLVSARPRAGTLSDAASKPLFVAGDAHWRGLARGLGVDHVLRVDARGRIQVTRAFAQRLRFEPGSTPDQVIP